MQKRFAVGMVVAALVLGAVSAWFWSPDGRLREPRSPSNPAQAAALPPWFMSVDEVREASKGVPEKPGPVGKIGSSELERHREEVGDKPKHVVVYVIDALRADRFGPGATSTDSMPFLHALSAEGIVFTNCFSNTTWTLPSVRSMLSGHRESTQVSVSQPGALSPGTKLLPEILSAHGWVTGLVSESPFVDVPYGLGQGFDTVTQNYIPDMRSSGGFRSRESSLAEWKFLARYPDYATFLYIQTLETHEPYIIPPWFSKNKPLDNSPEANRTAGYDNGTRFADHNLSLLVDMLKKTDVFKDTLLIVTADHGEALSDAESFDGPGHGGTLCPAKVRIPLVIVWPRRIARGQRCEENVQGLDIAPTILDLVGYEIPLQCEGTSLRPLLRGGPAEAFVDRSIQLRGSSGGRLMAGDTPDDSVALVKGDWLLLQSKGRDRLYPRTETDVVAGDRAKDQPGQVTLLKGELDKQLASQPVSPVPPQAPNAPNPANDDKTRRDALNALGYL